MLRPLVLALLALGAMAAWLGRVLATPATWLFLLGALPVWMLVGFILVSLHREEARPAKLGVATQLTLGRGVLLAALAGFVPMAIAPRTSNLLSPLTGMVALLPGLLYTAAAVSDLVDGYVARRWGEESPLGARLDVAMDALGLVVGPAAAVALGRLPAFYLLVGAAYYLFHGGLRWRRRRGLPVYLERLRPSRTTRMYAGYQMGLVATVLFPVVGPPGTTIAAAMFMVPNLTLFTRDWLVTTGRLQPGDAAQARSVSIVGKLAWEALAVIRLLSAGGIILLVQHGHLPPALLALSALLVLGVAPRLTGYAAGVFLVRLLSAQQGTPAETLVTATLVLTLLTLLGGGGRAALYPDDRFLLVRAGERPTPPA